ncbi:MAG TPA: histidinol-phosphate transaminase [Nitrososphaeraceae archaeon]|nr:histidinol-phosphate transaminase [Nitrososphaeraceae archaeon]
MPHNNLESCPHGTIYSTFDCSKVKIDFSSNINPLGISKFVLREIKNNLVQTSYTYPDPKCTLLKKSICEYIGCNSDHNWITVGNGATEIIHNFVRSLCLKNSIIPSPTFCEYELASKRCGMIIDYIPLSKKLHFEPDLIIEKVKKNPNSLIFLCNPNNPTGLVETKAIEKILNSIDNNNNNKTILMIDESFIEFLSEIEKNSVVSRIREFENLAILRSMTKSYGLAGLRLGYLIANPKLTQRLRSYQIAWNVNGIAQIAGIAALKDQKFLLNARKIIQKEREYMYNKINLKKTKVKALRSQVNFFLIKLKNVDSISYQKILLKYYGILVRDCSTFGGLSNNFIRVAVRKHNDNLKLLKAIYEINSSTNFDEYKVI